MAIASTDIIQRLSGGAANAAANSSLGGAKSSNVAPSGLFDTVSAAEAAAGSIEYRCVYVHNAHGTLTLTSPTAVVQSDTPDSTSIVDIGLGTSAVNATEQTVANETTAPAGVTFGAGPVNLGDIPAGQSRALWLRRTVSAGCPAITGDGYTIRVAGSTAA
jgi:hypothetical protein